MRPLRLVAYTLSLSCLCAALASCSASKKEPADAIALFGQVRTEAGTGLAGVQICFVGGDLCVMTDAAGNYHKPYDNKLAEPIIAQFTMPGYARRVVRMHNAPIAQAGVVLRQVDTHVRIALPAAGAAPVVVQASHADSSSTLSIGPNVLADAAGVLATGNANVSFTYFHPLQNLQTVPGALNAEDGNAVKALYTFGMADIEVEQNGALLAVAAGQTLDWHILEPSTIAHSLSPNGVVSMPIPNLYSLNANTGLWHLEGTTASGHVSYDANTTTLSTKLAHLSSWNVDSEAGPQYGGCIHGRVVDPCGKPIAAKAITTWFLGFEQLKDWTGTVTAGDGTFCTPTYLSGFNVAGNRLNINYFIAGADSVTDTTMCNPVPASCFVCVDEQAPDSPMGWCTNCDLDPTASQPANYQTEPPTYYTNTCNAPSIDLIPYSTCDAGNCSDVGDIVLNSPSCTTGNNPNAISSPNTTTMQADPCTNGTGKTLGQACAGFDVCCPRSLVCEDLLCVPPKDGG